MGLTQLNVTLTYTNTQRELAGLFLRRLTLRSHPRKQLCGRRTLFRVVRLVADAPRGELTVAILHQVGVLSTKKCLPLESIITIEVTRLAVTSYCAGTLLVRGCGERRCAVVVKLLNLWGMLESGPGAWTVHDGGSCPQVLRKTALVIVRP